MQKRSRTFGIKLQNSPILGVRMEFNALHTLIAKPEYRKRFRLGARREIIETPFMLWCGSPAGLLTFFLQRAFAGIEAYVVGAAYVQMGRLSLQALKVGLEKLVNPFSLGGRGVPDNYYNKVPALVSEDFALECRSPRLWEETRILYSEVRNPVFHGYEVDQDYAGGVLAVYDHIADMYRWIDGWCDPDAIIPGTRAVVQPKRRGTG